MNDKIDYSQLLQMTSQMQSKQSTSNKGLSYCEILSIVLIILRGMGYINCSWFVPFIPLFIPIALYAIVFIFRCIKK